MNSTTLTIGLVESSTFVLDTSIPVTVLPLDAMASMGEAGGPLFDDPENIVWM